MFTAPLLAFALAIQAQDEVRVSSHAYVPALRVDTRLVEIPAVVRDGHGRAISGLTKDDFRVIDDGRERLIDHFVVENALRDTLNDLKIAVSPEALKTATPVAVPRFLALFIDDVNGKDGALGGDLKRTQTAAEKFMKEALKPDVRIAIFTASGEPNLDFTTDESKLIEAIGALKAHIKMREDGLTLCPRVTPYLAMRIAYDHDPSAVRAVVTDAGQKNCPVSRGEVVTQAEETWRRVKEISNDTLTFIGRVVDHVGNMPGRRELLIASSGFLAVTMQGQKDRIIDHAMRAGVVISALDSKGLYGEGLPGSRPQDAVGYKGSFPGEWFKFETTELPMRLQTLNEPMANLAEGTGGIFYHNNNDLNAGFRELGNPPEVVYHLGFRPESVAADGAYHKLRVTAKKYSVQARPGYFANSEESLQSKIDREILAEDKQTGLPVGIAVQKVKDGISVIVTVDLSKLRFVTQGDRRVQKIAFTTALFDAQGKMAVAKEGLMDLSLTEATYKRLASSGVNAKVTLPVPTGKYKLRQVAEDGDGKIACSSHSIQIH